VVSPGYFVAEEGGHDAHRGVAMVGRILPTAEEQQLIDDITKFVASLNFDGLFDVDLIRTPDGKLYFTELNLRFGASGYAVTHSGVNLPAMFANYMIKGETIDLNCAVAEPGKRFISEKIMLDEYMNGYLTRKEMHRHMKTVDIHFIQDEQDPAAYRHFKKFYPLAALMRFVKSRKAKS
jgi:predicted ATP-grasp superfamily ATP-dependent carboligase